MHDNDDRMLLLFQNEEQDQTIDAQAVKLVVGQAIKNWCKSTDQE